MCGVRTKTEMEPESDSESEKQCQCQHQCQVAIAAKKASKSGHYVDFWCDYLRAESDPDVFDKICLLEGNCGAQELLSQE